jgi:hypothetical protein
MPDNPDRPISDEEIERLYNIMLRGLERRLERLGGRSPKAVEPIAEDATETPSLGGRSPKPVEPIDNDEPTSNVSN